MKPEIYRQGDVLIRRVTSIPANVREVPRDNGRVVLAYGEVTGHSHAIDNAAARFVENEAALRFLELKESVQLRHEEHATIELKSGVYEVVIQREYEPSEIRNVAD